MEVTKETKLEDCFTCKEDYTYDPILSHGVVGADLEKFMEINKIKCDICGGKIIFKAFKDNPSFQCEELLLPTSPHTARNVHKMIMFIRKKLRGA